jgi:hypothetical protein
MNFWPGFMDGFSADFAAHDPAFTKPTVYGRLYKLLFSRRKSLGVGFREDSAMTPMTPIMFQARRLSRASRDV